MKVLLIVALAVFCFEFVSPQLYDSPDLDDSSHLYDGDFDNSSPLTGSYGRNPYGRNPFGRNPFGGNPFGGNFCGGHSCGGNLYPPTPHNYCRSGSEEYTQSNSCLESCTTQYCVNTGRFGCFCKTGYCRDNSGRCRRVRSSNYIPSNYYPGGKSYFGQGHM